MLLMFGLSISCYTIHKICANLDSFIDLHNSFNSIINNNQISFANIYIYKIYY